MIQAAAKVKEAPAEDVARLRAGGRAFKVVSKPKTKKDKKLKGRKDAKGEKNPGAQVCLSFRAGFYPRFEADRAKIKDPRGKLVRPAKGKRPADLAWTGSRGARRVRAISRSLLVEAMHAAWVKGGRKV